MSRPAIASECGFQLLSDNESPLRTTNPGSIFEQKYRVAAELHNPCPIDRFLILHNKDLSSGEKQPSRLSVIPGLGMTYLTYQQPGIQTLSEFMMTVRVTLSYFLGKKWNITGHAFYSALTLSSNPSENNLTVLGGNLAAGYQLTNDNSVWKLSLFGGWYYLTAFTTPSTFGFQNVQGPQVFPTLTRILNNGQEAFLTIKYSPIFNGSSFLSLSNAEFATGLGYFFAPLKNGHAIGLTLDITYLTLQLSENRVAQFTTYTLGSSYRF